MVDFIMKPIFSFFGVHAKFLIGVLVNIVLIWAVCKLTDAFTHRIELRLKSKNTDSPLLNLMPVLNKIIKSVIVFMLLAGFLQSFGYNVTSLVAGFGITGLAVGFAAKEAIGNIFGSFGLLADRVYKIGDYIKFNGYEGTVENINLRSTTIRTLDGFVVNVPNNVLSKEEITNKLNDFLSKYGMQFSIKNDLKEELDDNIKISDVDIKDAPGMLITKDTVVNKPKKTKNKKVNK